MAVKKNKSQAVADLLLQIVGGCTNKVLEACPPV
jgi:hypothetical protein